MKKKFDKGYFDEDFYVTKAKGAIRDLDSPHYRTFAAKVAACLKWVPYSSKKSFKILDVGCGVGWEAKHYREYGYDACGVDVSKWAYENSVLSPDKKYKGDVRNLTKMFRPEEYPKNVFDLVIANRVLAYLPDKREITKAIENLIAVSKRHLLFAIICSDHKGAQVQKWTKGSGRLSYLPKAWYEQRFKDQGLTLNETFTKIMLAGDWDCVWWYEKGEEGGGEQ